MSSKISLSSPCHASWERMQLQENGRHCNACNKVVVDFTHMNDHELKNWFLEHRPESLCGHFRADQVKRFQIRVNIQSLPTWQWSIAQTIRLAIFMVFFSTLFSCTPTDEHKGEVAELVVDELKSGNNHSNANTYSGVNIIERIEQPREDSTILVYKGDVNLEEDNSNQITIPQYAGGLSPEFIQNLVDTFAMESNINSTDSLIETISAAFPGGNPELIKWFKRNLIYPEKALKQGISASPEVRFILTREGKASNITLVEEDEINLLFENEIIRLLENMPNWQPAMKNSEPIEQQIILTIPFKLGD